MFCKRFIISLFFFIKSNIFKPFDNVAERALEIFDDTVISNLKVYINAKADQ